jgi:hypothetical protein
MESTYNQSKGEAIQFFNNLIINVKDNVQIPLDIIIKPSSIGYFYLIYYKSKLWKENKLPWFDQAPIIFILRTTHTHFWGINFHYIQPTHRAIILKKLIHYFPEKYFNDEPLKPINWKLLQTITGIEKKHLQFAIKCYRFDHMVRVKGASAIRIKNTDFINCILYISPLWKDINESQVKKEIIKHLRK